MGLVENGKRSSRTEIRNRISLCSWWDFMRECFCFGSGVVNASGEAVRGDEQKEAGDEADI